ncbi:cyclin-dependent kinase regulatory subunit [Gregarina niphandrodes]|uniref:Cyclin-dependent kinases regulatory subunit n=1 Tax=Gregarina niphandrodes TaxID=110365 RepID=A0A023B165_GRENI|nr:cyclin-dependent kinase regulatory subunit [Gregarina niphandrodes]EZG45347.1 cyclin-dependent kinase regulatory subunit [Gregarina niphandrodes]|eukprot:XP_011132520.1 cyclin-dependent kinase regulatory subunit [Gregarina niphandrodes]
MVHYPDEPVYSDKYEDDCFEYRHVLLTKLMTQEVKSLLQKRPKELLYESDWRNLGVQQSRGWQHYLLHKPEPHVLLFRRPLGTDPQTGKPPKHWKPPSDGRASVPVTAER